MTKAIDKKIQIKALLGQLEAPASKVRPAVESGTGRGAGAAPGAPAAARRLLKDGVPRQGRPSQLVHDGDPGTVTNGVLQGKGATEHTYQRNSFDPSTEVNALSYTSGRVVKTVFNTYEKNEYDVFCYYTDWSQYDQRYENPDVPNAGCGRGIDMMKLKDGAFDKIVIGFAGIVGDKGEKQYQINEGARVFGRSHDEATLLDGWGDVLSYRNCGFDTWFSDDVQGNFNQEKAQGALGGLRKLKDANPNLRVSLSLGGWSMSEAFHWVAADAEKRKTLVLSIADIFKRFPMFSEIDIDWEYPAAAGHPANSYDDTDPPNFAELVKTVKRELAAINRPDVKISIAVAATVVKLEKANIPLLIEAGVYGINVMTYDFFGTPWAEELYHHTNLYPSSPSEPDQFSTDAAVQYLKSIGVPPKQIFIGYASYSRNAQNANLTGLSPLKGSYAANQGQTTTGTFESGTTEWYDVLYNYLDLENQKGLNGFSVYTDEIADADYLYNDKSKLFLSIDTPRSVRAKAQYVVEHGLGGIFTWTGDMDNGVLTNAAREGLGCKPVKQVVDMTPFYFKGVNIDPVNRDPVARITGTLEAYQDEPIQLSGATSSDPDGDPLSYAWEASKLPFDGATSADVSGRAPKAGLYPVLLTVSDGKGGRNTAQAEFLVRDGVPPDNRPPTARLAIELPSGTKLALSGAASSDPDGDPLNYKWQASGLSFDGATSMRVSTTVPNVSAPQDYSVTLEVDDGKGGINTTAIGFKAVPASQVRAVISGRTAVESGAPVSLSAVESTGSGSLSYYWSASGLPFNGATTRDVHASAPAVSVDTTFPISLKVSSSEGGEDIATVNLLVTAAGGVPVWDPEKGNYDIGDIVRYNQDEKYPGIWKRYQAKWWVASTSQPGLNSTTSDLPDGDNMPWYRLPG